MRLVAVFVCVSLVMGISATTLEQETCDVNRMMSDWNVNNADVLLAGMYGLRYPGSDGYGCGAMDPVGSLLYEATKWTLNRLNNQNYVNGVRFGMRTYDTCYSAHHTLSAAAHFYSQYSSSSTYCNSTGKYNLGIVGTLSSWTSRPLAGLTSDIPASVISMAATAPELSDKSEYPYFMRTAGQVSQQIKAMIAAMTLMGWERIIIVHSDNAYGSGGMREFVRMSQFNDICIISTIATPTSADISGHKEKLEGIAKYNVDGAVYFGSQHNALLEAVSKIDSAAEIQWFLSYVPFASTAIPDRLKGVMLVQEDYTYVSEFYDYFTTNLDENNPPVDNPWYKDWFMTVFQCDLGVSYQPFEGLSECSPKTTAQKLAIVDRQTSYVDDTIKAVMTYARAFKTAHTQLCGGASGMCNGLREMSPERFHDYLKSVDFDMADLNVNSLRGVRVKYDANGDFYSSGYVYYNYNNLNSNQFQWRTVGTYENGNFNLDMSQIVMYNYNRTIPLSAIPATPCPASGCRNCIIPRPPVHYTYSPGDVVLTGLFDLHAQGSEVLSCGALKASHALNAAAFRYAINTMKQQFPGILNGVDVGSLMIDLCDNAETGRLLLNNLLGGRHLVGNMDPNKLKAVIGELDSTEAISMASMLQDFNMPYIESSATSVYLYDQNLFGTFTRAIPSDFHQMLAIVLMLKKMDWTYVQVVYTNDAYGKSGFDMIKNEGAKRQICITGSHKLGDGEDVATIVAKLNEKPDARAVVAIVDSEDYRMMLKAMREQNLAGKFVLIGTETWGRKMSVVSGYETEAEGSITFDLSSPQVTQFTSWLSTLNPTDEAVMKEMPFFLEWYQYAFSCYLNAGNRGMYTQECNPNNPITQAPRFESSNYAPYMIYSTYAAARALDNTLRDVCGDANGDYDGICWQFRSDDEIKHKLLEYLKKSSFNLNGFDFNMINGEGQSDFNFYSYSNGQYTRIGSYTPGKAMIEMDFNSPVSLPLNFKSECVSKCSECVYLIQTRPFIPIMSDEADILLGANFALSNPGLGPFLCGQLRLTNGIQLYGALTYALEQVNNGNGPVSLNGVQLGALLMDHCNSEARAYGLPSALYSGILGDSQINLNALRTWMTDNTLVTEEMKDFFNDFNLPVISPMATSNMFLDEEEYPTFLRTVQGDSTIASALAVLVKSLGLQYVSVLYSANSFGRGGMESFFTIGLQEGLCIIRMIEMGSDTPDAIIAGLLDEPTHVVVTYLGQDDMETFLEARGRNLNGEKLVIISPEPYPLVFYNQGMAAKNLLSLRMRSNALDDFKTWMDRLGPYITGGYYPELSQYYMDLFQCNLPGNYKYSTDCGQVRLFSNNPEFFVDNYVLPVINAVYSFSIAVQDTLVKMCGEDYKNVCAKFYSDPETNTYLLSRMREVSYIDPSGNQFHFTGKEGNTGREIVLFDGQQMKKVADFAGASLNILDRNLRNMFENTISSCTPPCTECINNNMNFTFTPGDIMLGGIFDVHESSLTPFSCGKINTLRGFQLLEAFHFAIDKVNDKSGQFANVLKNVKLGGLGLDACQSAVKGGYLVSNLHSGLTVLERDGITVNPDSIEAYIGTYSSGNSIHLARLMKSLKVPQISFGASSVALLDHDRYPYFLRTVPADDRQAMGMIEFLRKYDIRYVQVVHTADNYGEQGAAVFNKLAYQEKICVSQTVSFLPQSSVTVENANDVVLDLLNKPVANTVVVFADTSYINELLQAIRRNPDAHGKFRFVGSETWANNNEAIEGVEDIAVTSVTVDLDVVDIREFDEHLASKTPANYPDNPWFPEYYEEIQNCYLTIPDTRFPGRCSASPKNIVTSRRYKQDTALIHVINAVYSVAYGLDLALREECGDDYTTVCEAYKNRDHRREFVLEQIRKASFVDLSGQPFSFSDRGDGNKGYVMYSLDSSNVEGYSYNPIAKYSSSGDLVMTKATYSPNWDGSCDRVDACTECPTIRNLLSRFMLPQYLTSAIQENPATLVYVSNIHAEGVDEYRCGAMNMRSMMQALATVYTLEQTNLIGSPFKIRPLILDNCNNPLRIDQDLFNLLTTGKLCNAPFDSDTTMIDIDSVMGVMTQGSRFVAAANRVTAPMKVQLMSSSASSNALSDQWRYPYFARTVPPDSKQMEVIAKILKANGWSYVGVLYTSESYGINGYKALQSTINDGLYSCIGYSEGLSPTATVDEIRPVIRRIAETDGIGVIVLIVTNPRTILEAIKAEGLASRFVVVGTDTWADIKSVTEDLAADFAGAITIGFRDAHFNDFVEWVKGVRMDNRLGIPQDWFDEFYQNLHECYLVDSPARSTEYTDPCDGFTNLNNDQGDVVTEDKIKKYGPLLLQITATYALGNGLNDFHRSYGCAGLSFAQCMANVDNSRDILFNYTLRQTWDISPGDVSPRDVFDLELGEDRYWDVGYTIYSLLNDNMYTKIGSQSQSGGFEFNDDGNYDASGIMSKCPEGEFCDCAFGDDGLTLQQNETRPKYMRDHEPRNYFMYDNETGEQIYDWPIWAIAVAVLTCIGLLVGLILFFYFLIFYPVRGGTTVLGFLMMFGLFGVYAINFAFFKPAAEDTCGARQFLLGVVYTVVFAPLFVKAVDNWRFKDSEYSPMRYVGLTNPVSLVLIALGIILVQCVIPIEWLILRPPSASLMVDSTSQHDWMWCDPHDFYDISMVLSMVFVVFLVVLTAIFSALAWDSESNYFESRWIFVSCVCTAGCMMVWMVVSTNAGPPYRDPSIAIANFVNATALLIFIPLRKLILLIQFSSEEEKAKTVPSDVDPNNELYSTVYTNQMYQPDVFQPDSKPNSEAGY